MPSRAHAAASAPGPAASSRVHQSDLRKAAQVIGSDAVSGNRELVHVGVADAVDGCFDAAPEFEVRRQCAVVTHSDPRTKKSASSRAVPVSSEISRVSGWLIGS
jgi:hypothetical protein